MTIINPSVIKGGVTAESRGIVKGAIVRRKLNVEPHGEMEPGLTRGIVNQIAVEGREAQVKVNGHYAWHPVAHLELCVSAPASTSQSAALPEREHVVFEQGQFRLTGSSQTEAWRAVAAGKLLKMESELEQQQELLYAEQSAIREVRLKIESGVLFDD